MHIPWSEVQLFLAIAEGKSLSAAAKSLGVTQPTVSRRLADLEATLGEQLFTRGVVGTGLTSFGDRLLEPARRMAEQAGELMRVASGADPSPRGVVRITAPPGVASDLLAPFAARLRVSLPEVRLEVVSSVSYLDLARREADLAMRIGLLARPPGKGDLVTLASLEQRPRAFASPDYVSRLRPGYGLADLDWIAWAPPFQDTPPNPQLAARIPGFRPAFASDDFLVQLQAAEAGVGAILLATPRPRLARATSLVELDLVIPYPAFGILLTCAPSSLTIPRVKAVADLLAAELAQEKRANRARAEVAPRRR